MAAVAAPPAVSLRALTAADAATIRHWEGLPEPYLRAEDLLESAELPGTTTSVAVDGAGEIGAIFQAAPEEDAERSVALLVHPGQRGVGYGTAALLAALDEPCYAGCMLRAVVDRENVASLRCFMHCGFVADDDSSSARYAHLTLATAPKP